MFSGAVYMDLPFTPEDKATLSTAAWDKAWTLATFNTAWRQIVAITSTPVETVVIKCHLRDVQWISDAMRAHDFNVHTHFWEKIDQNIHGTHKIVPSVECILVCLLRALTEDEDYWARPDMPVNPLERHSLILGPTVHKFLLDDGGQIVNRCQTPTYLAQALMKRYMKTECQVVLVPTAGTGSDCIGISSLGVDVLGIDNNEKMHDASCTRLRLLETQVNAAVAANKTTHLVELNAVVAREGVGCFGVAHYIRHLAQAEAAKAQEAVDKLEMKEDKKKTGKGKKEVKVAKEAQPEVEVPTVFCKADKCGKPMGLDETSCFVCGEPIHMDCAHKVKAGEHMNEICCADCLPEIEQA